MTKKQLRAMDLDTQVSDDHVDSTGAGKYEQAKAGLARNPNPQTWNQFMTLFAQIDALAD